MADFSELQNLRNQQQDEAKRFRQNMGAMEEEAARAQKAQGRAELTRALQDTRTGFNQRGLLFSGLRGSEEMGQTAGLASNLARARAATRSDLENTAKQYEGQALQTGLALQGLQQQAEDTRFENALAEREARMKGLTSLGGGIGSIFGNILGSKGK